MNTITAIERAVAMDPVFRMSLDWWYEQGLSWFVFTVIVSIILYGVRSFLEWVYRRQFKGWKLVLLGEDEDGQHQSLHWEEVRRILESDFERWKLVKSVVAGAGWLSVTRIKPAEEAGWTSYDTAKKKLVIDFNEIPPDHLNDKKWTTPPKYLRDDAKCPKPRPKPEALKESRAKQIYRRRKSLRTVRRVAPKKHYWPSKSVTEML